MTLPSKTIKDRRVHPATRRSKLAERAGPTNQALRILMIATEGPPTQSGIARTIDYLQRGLRARGHHVDVLAHPTVSRIVVREVRLYNLLAHLPNLIRSTESYDLVHLHGAAPTFSDAFLLFGKMRNRRTPLVYTHHCNISFGPKGLFSRAYNQLHYRLSQAADHQVFTTRSYATQVGAPDDASVIPLGIDLARFGVARPKHGPFTVLFVGQFRPYKGIPVLLRAVAQVPGIKLVLAGSGREESGCRAVAQELGIDAEFRGAVDDRTLHELYAHAHAVVLPSLTPAEAFGLVLLEGMAAGCVPIASDLPGVREVIGRIGFTVPPGSVTELAAVLRRLRDDADLVERIGWRARVRASGFDWDRTVLDYERLYLDLALTNQLATAELNPELPRQLAAHVRATRAAARVDLICRRSARGGGIIGSSVGSQGDTSTMVGMARLVGEYAAETGETVLVAPGRKPALLADDLGDEQSSAIAVPFGPHGRPIGAIVATREQAFDQRDLQSLIRLSPLVAGEVNQWLAQHWAPSRALGSRIFANV